MRIEKRIIDGIERDVQCYGSEQEYLDSEKDRRNMEHATRVANILARDEGFIKSLAHVIVEQLIKYKNMEK